MGGGEGGKTVTCVNDVSHSSSVCKEAVNLSARNKLTL